MKEMELEKTLRNFFKNSIFPQKPLLVGFSGGEDSSALVHCLQNLNIPFELAHFDHGWRKKSKEEQEELQKWAQNQDLIFHTQRSIHCLPSEEIARNERYAFFVSLFSTGKYRAIVLAHHREDQGETILKRIFEGAYLSSIQGMQPIQKRENIPIWRPLLTVSKIEIKNYIKKHRLLPLDDPTNLDEKYLRARMRSQLIPSLAKSFGKQILPSMLRLSRYSVELEEYLDLQTRDLKPISGPFGQMWNFSSMQPIEIRHMLRKLFKERKLVATEPIFQKILSSIVTKDPNQKIYFKKEQWIIDRQYFFWLKRPLPRFLEKRPLKEENFIENSWEWSYEISSFDKQKTSIKSQNWKDWWKGKISFVIPKGEYFLYPLERKQRKIQNTYKIPAFLRNTLPYVGEKDRPIFELLSGKFFFQTENQELLEITITIK